MELTNRELDLVKKMGDVKKHKLIELAILVVSAMVYFALRYFEVLRGFEAPADTLVLFYVTIIGGATFGDFRREDRYFELLRRYVNNDADAIKALSGKNSKPLPL